MVGIFVIATLRLIGNHLVMSLSFVLTASYWYCLRRQSLLFNTSKPFSRSQNCVSQDVELMVDCFVSCFRITPHNNDLLKVCLNPTSPTMFHFVLVNVLHRIITQVGRCLAVYSFHLFYLFIYVRLLLVFGGQRRGSVVRTSLIGWRTFPDLRLWFTCDHFVGKVSTMG